MPRSHVRSIAVHAARADTRTRDFSRTAGNLSRVCTRAGTRDPRLGRKRLHETVGMWVAVARRMTDTIHTRVRGEYREMPGLRLTIPQAARLFNLDHAHCVKVLDKLVTEGELWSNGREYFGQTAGRRSA